MKPDQTTGNITIRQVAEAVGVAVSTVSKGLRNDPSIPPGRCLEIQGAAHRLGYRPHPLVAALMSRIHRNERGSPAIPHTVLIDAVWVEP